jgi:hypothetical protein
METRNLWAALAAFAALLAACTAGATTFTETTGCASSSFCTLEELNEGGTIQVHDKLFGEWEAFFFDDAAPLSDVEVHGIEGDPLDPGLEFRALNDAVSVSDIADLRLLYFFNVTVVDPTLRVKDNSLSITCASIDGEARIQIDEGVFPVADDVPALATKSVFVEENDLQLYDAADFPPTDFINVRTSVHLSSKEGGSAALDSWEQRFSQRPVPEPSAALVFGAGLAVAGASRRRRATR